MKKLLIISILAVSLFGGMKSSEKMDYTELDKKKLQTILKSVSSKLAISLPIIMDNVTTAVRVHAYENKIRFYKQIDISSDVFINKSFEPEGEIHQKAFKLDGQIVCNNSFFNYLIYKRKAILEYEYLTKGSRVLFEHSIALEDCEKLEG